MTLEVGQFMRSTKPLRTALRQRLDKFQCEVEASQVSTSQEALAKINKKVYHFKKKGNKGQFNFNQTVEDHIDAANWPLQVMWILEKRLQSLIRTRRLSGSGRNTSASQTVQTGGV